MHFSASPASASATAWRSISSILLFSPPPKRKTTAMIAMTMIATAPAPSLTSDFIDPLEIRLVTRRHRQPDDLGHRVRMQLLDALLERPPAVRARLDHEQDLAVAPAPPL